MSIHTEKRDKQENYPFPDELLLSKEEINDLKKI